MDLGDGEKSLVSKLPPFTGKSDDFIMWLAKFTAIATMGAFTASIAQNPDGTFGESDCPKDEAAASQLNLNNNADKAKHEAWKRNSKAFAALTLVMPNNLFRIIVEAGGIASKAMELL
jgi:hypothetical protein